MIVPDANLLIYAYDSTSPSHRAARRWWEDALSGSEPVGIPWIVVLAFVRLISHPTLLEHPLTVREAEGCVRQWVGLRSCAVAGSPGKNFRAILFSPR